MYQSLFDADPNELRTALKLAELYLKTHAKSSAIKIYLHITDHYRSLGAWQKVKAICMLLLRLDPDLIEAHELLLDEADESGDQERVETQLKRLRKLYESKRNPELLFRAFEQYLNRFPDSAELRLDAVPHCQENG